MNKNKNRLIFLLIVLIFISFSFLAALGYKDYSNVIREDISNITKLVSTNIYSELQIELLKPIFVSLTMANDNFVKNWVIRDHESDIYPITYYLQGIKDKYGYDSTFFVSNITNNYYHYDGILKQISPDDNHDQWFYDFLALDKEYALDIDTDQAAGDDLTLFVNCRLKDGDNILGVTGAGVKMSKIQDTIKAYQKEYDVEIFLMTPDGTIQIHADENVIEKKNAFEDEALRNIRYNILNSKDELKIFEPTAEGNSHYIVSYYVEELDWYLIVHKNSEILNKLLFTQKVKQIIIFVIMFLSAALIIIYATAHYHKKNTKLAKTDHLTEIDNRSAFDESLNISIARANNFDQDFTLAVIDIDNFKVINDIHGHVHGDLILKHVAEHLKSFIRSNDIIARWGGDEFTIIFNCDNESAKKILQRVIKLRTRDNMLTQYSVTFSIGISQYRKKENAKALLDRADKALYMAKKEGKNRICSI